MNKIIYLITILSGAAGLVYEITWTRMLVLVFGSTTHSIVAIAYEILWTRLLIPIIETFTYAFALILIIYLIGIALGIKWSGFV